MPDIPGPGFDMLAILLDLPLTRNMRQVK